MTEILGGGAEATQPLASRAARRIGHVLIAAAIAAPTAIGLSAGLAYGYEHQQHLQSAARHRASGLERCLKVVQTLDFAGLTLPASTLSATLQADCGIEGTVTTLQTKLEQVPATSANSIVVEPPTEPQVHFPSVDKLESEVKSAHRAGTALYIRGWISGVLFGGLFGVAGSAGAFGLKNAPKGGTRNTDALGWGWH